MLMKIDSIHELEQQLVKIESNLRAADARKHGGSNYETIQGNNHIMNEIRGTIREMIHSQNMVNKTVSMNSADGLTVNEMLEEVEKAATRTATSLLSTIVKPQAKISVSPDLTSGASSSLSTAALTKIDAFKAQLEDQNTALKQKLSSLEEKLRNFETTSSNTNANVNEIEQLKNLIIKTQRKHEEDKMNLLKEFENERNLTSNSNMMMMKKFRDELEKKMNEKDDEMRKYLQTLHSFMPQQQTEENVLYNEHVHRVCRTVESSFLTEEEEAIARISQRIHLLKAKIDSKDNKSKDRSGASDESDDTDTRELIQLNEQIRQLKSRMIKKNQQLQRSKKEFQVNPQSIMKHDKVYLPIQHIKKHYSSEDNLHLLQNNFPVKSKVFFDKPKPQYHHTNSKFVESYSVDSNDEQNENSKYFVINQSGSQELSCSPERRYTSSIEIPAEQLEDFKAKPTKSSSLRRAKSASHMSNATIESNLKKHSAKIQTGSNLISVCLKSLKRPTEPEPKKTSPRQVELTNNLKEAQKEIEELKEIIEEKNTLINSHRVSAFDKKKHDKEMLYLLQLLENQSKKIIGLKNKIKDYRENGNWNSDTMSSLSDSLDRVRNDLRDNLKTANNSDIEETYKMIKNNEENKRQRKNKVSYKDDGNEKKRSHTKIVSESGVQTDGNSGSSMTEEAIRTPLDQINDDTQIQLPLNALVCNIPEHHELEDLAHQNREQIINLKNLLQQTQDDLIKQQMNNRYDVDMVERRAEFDALDLAINNRKKILYDLEMRKRHELNSSMLIDDHYVPISEKGAKYLKVRYIVFNFNFKS